MADEKTGNAESNSPQPVNSTGAPLTSSGAPVPSPEHPPVSHMMPHPDVVPNQPVTVPPKPPTSNMMPGAPETKIELTTPPPPQFDGRQAGASTPEKASVPNATPVKDTVADDVGLVKPAPRATPPDPLRAQMDKILKGIKLPEKRAYAPAGEQKPPAAAPAVASEDARKLEDILSAHITENTSVPTTPQTPAAPSTVPDQEVFHEQMEVASVHTLKQDLQHVVQEQKISVVKAVALEQEKRQRAERMEPEPPKPPSRAPAIIFTIVLFLGLGGAALAAVYYVAVVQSAPGAPAQNTSLVFAEQTVTFPLTTDSPQSLRAQLAQSRTGGGTLGSLLHIVPVIPTTDASGAQTQRPATLSEFFSAIGAEPPENLLRALGDEFFLGIHTVDKNAPILVIKVNSYDRAFDGMLTWEQTMNSDLQPLFTPVPHLVMGADGLQTERPFTDVVMRNYDVRALKDDQGVIQLYYSFPTRDLLVIAESPYTFTEILSRLQAGRRL